MGEEFSFFLNNETLCNSMFDRMARTGLWFLQVCSCFSAFPFFGLCNCDINALEPLLCVLFIFGLENVRLTVCEDFKGSGKAAISAFLGHNFDTLDLTKLNGAVIWIIFLEQRKKRLGGGRQYIWLLLWDKLVFPSKFSAFLPNYGF